MNDQPSASYEHRSASVATSWVDAIFLRQVAATGLAAGACSWTDVISASADELRSRGMACILLWMQGGPSQFETFSPKPQPLQRWRNQGDFSTSVSGIQIAEHLPNCATVMDELAIIRSMTSKEGNHQRASYFLHHGYLPMGGVKFPTLGSNVAHQLGDAARISCLATSVSADGYPMRGNGGFLGVDYDPLVLNSAGRMPPQNTKPRTRPGSLPSSAWACWIRFKRASQPIPAASRSLPTIAS